MDANFQYQLKLCEDRSDRCVQGVANEVAIRAARAGGLRCRQLIMAVRSQGREPRQQHYKAPDAEHRSEDCRSDHFVPAKPDHACHSRGELPSDRQVD